MPQGSIFGPLLLIIFINDIVEDIDAFIKLFVHDTSIYIQFDDSRASAEILESDIHQNSHMVRTMAGEV